MKKLRVGVIGCGAVAQRGHLSGYASNPESKIVAVCDINKSRAIEVAKKFNAETWVTDYRELLKRKDIQAVSICVPNFIHKEIAIASAEAGKHILIEKPMATSVKECDAMIHAATKAGVKLMVGHVMRFAPGYSYARKFIEEGYLGNIFCLRSTLRHSGPYKYWGAMSKWFFDRRKSGGGVLTDLGPHMIDISRYLLKDEIESVTGILGSFEKDGAERDAIVILKFKKPVFSEISVSWSTSPLIVKTEIFGSEGSIIIDNFGGQLSLCSKKDKLFKNNWINVSIISESGFFVAFQREINHFIDCILHDKKPLVDGQDGKKTVEVIEKVYKFNKSD